MRAPVAQLDRASASGVEGRGFESRRVYHFFVFFWSPLRNPCEKQAPAWQINLPAGAFSFCFGIFCIRKKWDCLLLSGCPALLAHGAAMLALIVAPLLVESRRVYHFRHLSARVYNFCGFFVICCKMMQKPVHRSRSRERYCYLFSE